MNCKKSSLNCTQKKNTNENLKKWLTSVKKVIIISSLTLYYGENPNNPCKINGCWDLSIFHENRTNPLCPSLF